MKVETIEEGLTGGFEVKLDARATCVEPMLLMDKASSYLVGRGKTHNGRFDLLGRNEAECAAIEEALDDAVANSIVDASMGEHAKAVNDAAAPVPNGSAAEKPRLA